ncbi:dethiobiotin synthase [Ferrimonas gelatinilytica]|uniref:ATP-dependent dethiobiotin synthetase BioD n=1 Tax=Ferrimonas gelatinilytica TaxID=1255257 RepID=A0ABP9SHW9_9GAMM
MIYFVTGTDTDVGKTRVAAALLTAAARQGLNSLGLKPIAAGCEQSEQGWRNDDALTLMAASTQSLPYEAVNPFAFEPPIAPHLAAERVGVTLSVTALQQKLPLTAMANAEFCLVEGAGGWQLPLSGSQSLPDWVVHNGWPVILVVGMKLGCLNHALLTADAIRRDGLRLAGWIANRIDPDMALFEQNLATLEARLGAPRLATIPFEPDGMAGAVAACTEAVSRLQSQDESSQVPHFSEATGSRLR